MKYLSLFSGIGGFEYGIQRAFSFWDWNPKERDGKSKPPIEGVESAEKSLQPKRGESNNLGTRNTRKVQCIGFSEVNKYAKSIYKRHFPSHLDLGDATLLCTETLPEYDLLVAGFPCQSFSVAGRGGGFCDPRGTLFFEIIRILTETRPRNFLLENVRGLLSNDGGRTFQTIIGLLTNLGYLCEWQVLNSKDFGVPQNRERVFIAGHLGGRGAGTVFPLTGTAGEGVVKSSGKVSGFTTTAPIRYPDRNLKDYPSKYSLTIDTCNSTGVNDGSRIRRLTPVECERLQGFPDDWTKYGANGEEISDTQRYKCLGNAVTTNVVSAVIGGLYGC